MNIGFNSLKAMRVIFITLAFCLTAALATAYKLERIVGGVTTPITSWPFAAALLYSRDLINYQQECGGSIISQTAIVSAAHCFHGDAIARWRVRVGSALSASGGVVHNLRVINSHPGFNVQTYDNDVAVLRTTGNIAYSTSVLPGSFAVNNYQIMDNDQVTAIGWGHTAFQGAPSTQLRQVQIWSVNQDTCKSRYAEFGGIITDNMFCAGWLDRGERGQCKGDAGSALIHNNVIVGIYSWGYGCANPRYPSVNTRVSTVINWIQTVAMGN